ARRAALLELFARAAQADVVAAGQARRDARHLVGRRTRTLALLPARGFRCGEARRVLAQFLVGKVAALRLLEGARPRVVLARVMLAIPVRHLAKAVGRRHDGVAAGEAVGADVARRVDAPVDAEQRRSDGAEADERARLADVVRMDVRLFFALGQLDG